MYDVTGKDKDFLIQAEYKGKPLFFRFRPFAGGFFSSRGTTYAYGGLLYDLLLWRFAVIPSLAAGYYQKGRGKDLGYPLEFRTSLEVAVRLPLEIRLGAQISHLSNGNLANKNPGLMLLVFSLSFPLF